MTASTTIPGGVDGTCQLNGGTITCNPGVAVSAEIQSYPGLYKIHATMVKSSDTTITATSQTYVVYVPASPGPHVVLTAPDNVSVDSARDTVSWDAVTGAAQYSLRIEQDGIEIVNRSTSSASQDLSRPISGPATVKVKACYDTALTICGVDAVYELAAAAPPAPPRDRPANPPQSNGSGSSSRSAVSGPPVIPTQDHSRLPAGAEVQSEVPWIAFSEVSGAAISNAAVRNAAKSAIDVWGPLGVNSEVCFPESGSLLLLDTAYSPRRLVWLDSYQRADGKTCAHIDRAGTVALMPPRPTATPVPRPTATPDPYLIADPVGSAWMLPNCVVSSDIWLNLRAHPAGAIMGLFLGDAPAIGRTENWFHVMQDDRLGWISAHYVETEGDCD